MLAEIRLKNFRSYADDSFEFTPGVNIIVGPNASGKTNLLEAILVVSKGSSYRVKDSELVSFEAEWSRLDTKSLEGAERTVKIVLEPSITKTYELAGKPYKRLGMGQMLPVVLFEPNHLQMLSGGPERRRNYLDDVLEQTQIGYGTLRRQYKRTLAQRNTLLKRPSGDLKTQLFPWNVRLSQLAGQVVRARASLVEQIQITLPGLYKDLSHVSTVVEARYGSQWPVDSYETNLLKKLETTVDTDKLRGFTSNGPHREDLIVLFDGHPAQESASRGEARTLVLALKIIEMKLITIARDVTPLLLLDDVFSELDGARRHALTEQLSNHQTFITTTDADIVLQHFTDRCNVIPLTH